MSLIVSFDPNDYTDEQVLKGLNAMVKFAILSHANTVNLYTFGPTPQGDMAQDAFDQEFKEVLDSSWYDYLPSKERFNKYLAVADRRGLGFDISAVEALDEDTEFSTFLEGVKHARKKPKVAARS